MTKTQTVRRLTKRHALTCEARECHAKATVAVSWKTTVMPCSAFYYYCDSHAPAEEEIEE